MNVVARRLAAAPFYYGWAVASAVSVTIVASMTFALSTFSIFVEPIEREFGWSRTAISGAISFGTVGSAIAGPILGRLTDRYGARLLMTGGTLLMAGSLVGLSRMSSLIGLYAFFTLGRIVMMNAEHLVGPTVIANWFIRQRALSTALVLAASRVGIGLWPALAGVLFLVSDWRFAFLVMALSCVVISVLPWLLIIARRPEDVGMLPDGDADSNAQIRFKNIAEPHWTAGQAVRTQAFWVLMIATTFTLFSGAGVGLHRIPYLIDKGISDSMIGLVLVGFAIGMAAGGFLIAQMGRIMSDKSILSLGMAYAGGLMIVLLHVPPNGWAAALAFGEGIAFGGMLTVVPVIYANFYGRMAVGTIRGLAFPATMAGNAGGALFAGVVYDVTGRSYTWVFGTFAILLFVAALMAWSARPPLRS